MQGTCPITSHSIILPRCLSGLYPSDRFRGLPTVGVSQSWGRGIPVPGNGEPQDGYPRPGQDWVHCIHFGTTGTSFHYNSGKAGGYVFTGVCSTLLGGVVPHLHPIILPLVPCPFQEVLHLHPIILPLILCPSWVVPQQGNH